MLKNKRGGGMLLFLLTLNISLIGEMTLLCRSHHRHKFPSVRFS